MGKPNSDNAYKFMFDGLNRKWVTKGPWQLVDLPNGFFAVKFQLFEDMDYALCNGPWIIAGQTLVVQKWKPDFDPVVDTISRMAVWVRILDLPVKYYKEFTLKQIGGLIGPVVRIDKVTLAQTRGKFCRLCVEINLNEPLKPLITLNKKTYGVVYEGISTICFNCGVYGHVRDQCPYVSEDRTSTKNQDAAMMVTPVDNTHPNDKVPTMDVDATTSLGSQQVEKVPVIVCNDRPISKNKENPDVGPWMVMSYRNRKQNSTTSLNKKKNANLGSRFTPLLNNNLDFELVASEPVRTEGMQNEPTIVKLWKNMQDQLKNEKYKLSNFGKRVDANNTKADANSIPGNKAAPLKDISNVGSSSMTSPPAKVKASKHQNALIKGHASKSLVKSSFPIKCDFANVNSDLHPFSSMDAQFGHSPPEECAGTCPPMECARNLIPTSLEAPPHGSTSSLAVIAADDTTKLVDDVASSNEEEMVDTLFSSAEEDMVTS